MAARGAAALSFGLVTFAWPTMTVATFVALFAVFALSDGVLTLVTALRFRSRTRDARGVRDPLFGLGVVGIAGGLAAAVWPEPTMQTILGLVAAWAAATGGGQLLFGARSRTRLPGAWLLAGAGAAGLALAIVLGFALALGEVRVGWELGAYGAATGVLLGVLAWRVQGGAAVGAPNLGAADAFAPVPPAPEATLP